MGELIEDRSRQVFDPVEVNVDMAQQRVTDCPNNTRVHLPKPMPAMKEAMSTVRVSEWNSFRGWFKENFTNDKGEKNQT